MILNRVYVLTKSRLNFPAILFVLLFVVAGCTTANQQSLGVSLQPTTSASQVETVASVDEDPASALASPEHLSPAENAVLEVASVEVSKDTVRIGFLPITGASQASVSALSRALGKESAQRNFLIVGLNDQSARYRLKGYMSALNEGSTTTVTFYWDVLDRDGKRLYRINGFENNRGSSKDPWDGVSAKTINNIASRTMSTLQVWVKRQRT